MSIKPLIYKFTYSIDTDTDYPDELDTLLGINKNENKSEVVRKKLLMYSMLDKGTVGNVFGQMAESLMPCVIEWIGRDRPGFEAMYYLLLNDQRFSNYHMNPMFLLFE